MGVNGELGIDNTLVKAFTEVRGEAPTTASPMVVLAAYLYSLKNEYGLTDTQHLDADKIELPTLGDAVREFIDHFLPGSANVDSLRNSLYAVFTYVADNADFRRSINKSNKLSDGEVLLLGQIAWNMEHNAQRPRLPLKPREISRKGKPFTLDIPVPKRDQDLATMRWTERRNLSGVPGKSTAASFGSQAARLAVLAAKWLLDASAQPAPDIGGACLLDGDRQGTKRIVWDEYLAPGPTLASTGFLPADSKAQVLGMPQTGHSGPVFVGDFTEVGDRYQLRGFDSEVTRLWDDGGDRRVWLRGGPGLGKSYAARRVMQEALSNLDDDRQDLLIWVNSANSATVTREFSRAAERIRGLGNFVPADAEDRDDQLTQALLDHLRTTDLRWLIVFDDADADDLIERKLVPPGTNPRGRVLITTLSGSHRIDGAGRYIEAELFSQGEAEEFLKNRLPETSVDENIRLAGTVSYHPLALSIAASTIAANGMTVSAWIEEFEHAGRMDDAADFSDVGGYPRLIGTAWQLALDRASRGMPNGVVERAAMIAALQDPAGHPTWLWQRDNVSEWVAGETDLAPSRGRMHPGVKRLVDYGIIRLVGGWLDGRITIHQLAARAIRESAAPETLAELGALLADQWLLELTVHPANTQPKDVRAGLGPIAALANLDSMTRNTAIALLDFSQPSTSEQVLEWERAELELFRPHLSRGGVLGLADLARRLVDIGLDERGLGRHGDAHRNLTEAADIYEQLTETPDLSDDLRAKYLESLADLDAEMNRPRLALERRTNAARLRERFEASNLIENKPISNQLALVDVYQKLLDPHRTESTLERALLTWKSQIFANTEAEAATHAGLGRRLASAGRTAEAEKYLRRAAEIYETTDLGRIVYVTGIATELGYICARDGKWSEAEDWFTRSEREPVPLASVLLHQGRGDDARATLARAAKIHTEAVSQSDPTVDAGIREDIEDSLLPILYSLAHEAGARGRLQDAADLTQVCLELTRVREDLSPGDDPAGLASAYFSAGKTALSAERLDKAVAYFTSCASIREMLARITSADDDLQLKYGQSLYWLARANKEAGVLDSAVSYGRCAVEILGPLDSEDARQCLSDTLSFLGGTHLGMGDAEEAIASLARHVHIWESEHEKAPDSNTAISLSRALKQQWLVLIKTHRWNEAVQPLVDTISMHQTMSLTDTQDGEAVAEALFYLAYVYYSRGGSPSESVSSAEQSVRAWQDLLDVEPSNLALQVNIAHALYLLAGALNGLDRDFEVVSVLNRAANHLQLPTELRPDDNGPLLMEVLTQLERCLRALGRYSHADEICARADDLARRYPSLGGEE